jgi:2,3-bisphosphoglycerate-dependent phosphoglycerate mutase
VTPTVRRSATNEDDESQVQPGEMVGLHSRVTDDVESPVVTTTEGFRQHRYEPPPSATTILLVRHGESEAALPDRPFALKDGHGDPRLHENGRKQAELVGERLKQYRFDAIYVTSLVRTHETAAPLASALGMTPIEVADLREVHFGDWEGGMLRMKAAANDPIYLRMMAEERWDIIPNAEPLDVFRTRLQQGLRTIVDAHPGGQVVAVVHGGVIGQLLSDAVGVTGFAFTGADNGSISELVIDGDVQRIRRFNDTAHLYG